MQGLPRSQENWGAKRTEDGDPKSPGPPEPGGTSSHAALCSILVKCSTRPGLATRREER